MFKRILVFLFVFNIVILPLYAGEHNAVRKFARGVANVMLSWTEVPREMIDVAQDNTGTGAEVAGFFLGSLRGFGFFFGRTILGIYEIATFPIPPYKPLVEPEFVLSNE